MVSKYHAQHNSPPRRSRCGSHALHTPFAPSHACAGAGDAAEGAQYDAWAALDTFYSINAANGAASYTAFTRSLHSDAVPDFKGRYGGAKLTSKQLKSETKRLRRLVSYWKLNTDIPRLGQYCTTRASPRARNGYAGRVWSCDVPKIVTELDRDPSLYLCELSAKVQLSTGRKYSKKALMAYL